MEHFELKDYLSILRRQKTYFFIVFSVIFLLSIVIALRWSNYRSIATFEVAPPEISSDTTKPMGMTARDYSESFADMHINHLQQTVLSTTSLIDIITKFNLYPDARKSTPVADIADRMQKKIKLELVSSTLSSAAQKSANSLAASTFSLSFDYDSPLIAQQVANELVTRFLDEDLKERRNAAHETSVFLEAQIKALEVSMVEQEKNISDFRAANSNLQPESLAFNQQASQSIMLNIQNIDAQLTTNQGSQGTLRAQLAAVDPYSRLVADGQVMTSPSVQLKALKSQYETLSAQYGPGHPDVIKTRHQIEALEKHIGAGGSGVNNTADIEARIDDTRTNLAAARKTYGPNHPDVIALQHKLSALQKQLAQAGKSSYPADGIRQDADNPAYLQIVAELRSSEDQYKSLMAQKNSLLKQQAKYQSAVAANPVAEQKLASLSRDYENSQQRYRELKEKKMAADMSETIEQNRNGERMVMINPPELPQDTHPTRMLFVLGGFIFALIAGTASVVVAQLASHSVVGARHLEALAGVAPLVIVPHILTAKQQNSRLHAGLFRKAAPRSTT